MLAGLEDGDGGHDSDRRARRDRAAPARPRRGDGVSGLRALSAHDGAGESLARACASRRCRGRRSIAASRGREESWGSSRCSIASRSNSPEDSGSASPWGAPWCASRRCSCSTSRCPISTRAFARRCASRSAALQRRLNTTTVYVTHDQVEAMTLGDRIVVLADGRIQQVGRPIELYRAPANRFVAGFIGTPPHEFHRRARAVGGRRPRLHLRWRTRHASARSRGADGSGRADDAWRAARGSAD